MRTYRIQSLLNGTDRLLKTVIRAVSMEEAVEKFIKTRNGEFVVYYDNEQAQVTDYDRSWFILDSEVVFGI